MIGNLIGEVIFSDGIESIIMTNSGVGYQVFCNEVLVEGNMISLFIGHIIKEGSQDLYGFTTLRDKKMFELLISVKGVGPKSGYSLLSSIGTEPIINAITLENKKILTSAPGIGNKAASQILLDLCGKVQKINMYTNSKIIIKSSSSQMMISKETVTSCKTDNKEDLPEGSKQMINDQAIIEEALMACTQLGFKEEKIIPIAQKIMREVLVGKSEQLVHLVLKEI